MNAIRNWVSALRKKPTSKFGQLHRSRGNQTDGSGLILAYFDPSGLSTISENIASWSSLSKFRLDVWNFYGGEFNNGLELPKDIKLSEYDFVIFHCTVTYNPENVVAIINSISSEFSTFSGVKVLMKQDDHYKPHLVAKIIGGYGFDLLISIVGQDLVEQFYPRRYAGEIQLLTVHTGYVSDTMRRVADDFLNSESRRNIDIGYRGSIQPDNFGALAYEKRSIGELVSANPNLARLKCDISSAWEDRFLGVEWYRFLASCKTVLGVESGASIVDFDGTVEAEVRKYRAISPNATFEELSRDVLQKFENNLYYRAISPRHLEAIATGTVQLLFEGHYSGLLQQNRHYFPLRRDLGNAKEAYELINDERSLARFKRTAFEEVFCLPALQYSHFVESVDSKISKLLNPTHLL